jgi:hypothetical protein
MESFYSLLVQSMAVPGPNVREGHKKKETDNPDKMGRASGA